MSSDHFLKKSKTTYMCVIAHRIMVRQTLPSPGTNNMQHRKLHQTCHVSIYILGVLNQLNGRCYGVPLGLKLIAWLSIKYNERNRNVYLGKVCPQMYTMKSRANEPTFSINERKCAATKRDQRSKHLIAVNL